MYAKFVKRTLDFVLSLLALLVLSPLLLVLTAAGAVAMRGNPFFVQPRPGKKGRDGREKIFRLIKFRTMDDRRDREGNLLPDDVRLNRYGRLLRATSLDELPELLNILKGDMSVVGPRPLLVKYLPYYTEEERRRHDVRPGLTGNAQAHGRNALGWEEKFRLDVEYVDRLSFGFDVRIIADTVRGVLRREGISQEGQATMEDFEEYAKERNRAAVR